MPDQRIIPVELRVSDAELDDLKDRLHRARWPERETVRGRHGEPSWEQGPPLALVEELAEYWATGYDWRVVEHELNAHNLSSTNIDGLDIQFLHMRSPRVDARPLILTHGWPSSIIEPLQVMDALANPPAGSPAFHVVAPSLPGFGFAARPAEPGWGVNRTADAWAELMHRLGHERFFAAGGDWGGRVTTALGIRHPSRVIGLHTFTPYTAEPSDGDGDLSPREARWLADTRNFWRFGSGYSLVQSTRPQTIAYALVDSPIAQLTWILEKLHFWTDRSPHGKPALSPDRILDVVSYYWFSATGGSSARFYWENFPPERRTEVRVPTAVSVFPAEFEKLPRHWVEARYTDLRYWGEPERGGHFPMLEVPELYVDELRSGLSRM